MHVGIEDQLENEEAIIDHANVDHVEDNCNQNNGNMPLLEESGRHCLMNNTAWWMICVDSIDTLAIQLQQLRIVVTVGLHQIAV